MSLPWKPGPRNSALLTIPCLLALCAACTPAAIDDPVATTVDAPPPTAEFEPREDCDWGSSTICDGVASAPGPALAGAEIVASVFVETIDPTRFNTADGRPPDEPYGEDTDPDFALDATIEAVFEEQVGPDWEDREWDEAMERAEATVVAIEEDFDARWREFHGFELGRLVVMRVEPDPGVLRGEQELGWVVSVLNSGRAEVREGRHAGCVFEQSSSGCQEHVEQDESGIALFSPVYQGRADYFHFFDHCTARAAEIEQQTGTGARCMELSWFLRETTGGWRWDGGEGDGVLDMARMSELMRRDG